MWMDIDIDEDYPTQSKRFFKWNSLFGVVFLSIIALVLCLIIVPVVFIFVYMSVPTEPINREETIAGYPIMQTPPPSNESLLVFNGTEWITNSPEITIGYINITGLTNQLIFKPGINQITVNAMNVSGNYTYTIPDPKADASFVLDAGNYTFSGTTVFEDVVYFNSPQPQICFQSNPNNSAICIFVEDPVSNYIYELENVNKNTSFVLTDGNWVINGLTEFTSTVYLQASPGVGQILFEPGGSPQSTVLSVSTPTASRIVTVPDPGVTSANILLDHGTQTVYGATTFLSTFELLDSSEFLQLQQGQFDVNIGLGFFNGSRTYTIPDIGSNGFFVLSSAIFNPNITTTFNVPVILAASANQLEFQPGDGGSNGITINVNNPSQNLYYTLEDIGMNGTFAFLEAHQTWIGTNKFGATTYFTPTSNQITIQPGDSGSLFNISTTNPTFNVTLTIPDLGVTPNTVLYSTGTQTVSGSYNMLSQFNLAATINQLAITPGSTGTSLIINAANPVATRDIFLNDPGTNATFVLTAGFGQTMAENTTFSSVMIMNGGVTLPTTGGTPAILNYYESETGVNTIFNWTTNPVTFSPLAPQIRVQVIGQEVTWFFDKFSGTCNSGGYFYCSPSCVPSKWQLPQIAGTSNTNIIFQMILVINNGVNTLGMITIDSTGTIQIGTFPSLTFTAPATCGWDAFSVRWLIV